MNWTKMGHASQVGLFSMDSDGSISCLNDFARQQDILPEIRQAETDGLLDAGVVITCREQRFYAAKAVMRAGAGPASQIVVSHDVTEQSRQQALQELLGYTLGGYAEGICITAPDGRTVWVNKAYEALVGKSRTELVGRHVFDHVSGGAVRVPVALEVLKTAKPVSTIQRMGTGKLVFVLSSPIFDPDGSLCGAVTSVRDIASVVKLYEELKTREHSQAENALPPIDNLVARSAEMRGVIHLAEQMAEVDTTLLVQGETGTGKDMIARLVHLTGSRASKPFIKVNCGAIPDTLFESELFGYDKGAFTGATATGKVGLIELANHGTLFLDEIGEMPLIMQVKLLTVIQDKRFYRVGGVKPIDVDVRIIAATNQALDEMVRQSTFREDLFYRLNVVSITVPPLRERTGDIVPLTLFFLKQFNQRYNRRKFIVPDVYDAMRRYHWPGNVRELQNLIERLVVLGKQEMISHVDLPGNMHKGDIDLPSVPLSEQVVSLEQAREKFEKRLVVETYRLFPNSYQLAERLGISQSTASRLIRKYVVD